MVPWVLLASTDIPGDGGEMRLYRRGPEFSIRVGPHELMNSRVHASEEALAELACAPLADHDRARILIGGLGMGFTLAAVLSHVGPPAVVDVAELVPAVVAWNRAEMAEINGAALADARVTVRESDVARIIGVEKNAYDAILLDVDNGPSALTSKSNARLYGASGLKAAHAALRPGGVLAVWSADHDPSFTKRLSQAGFHVEEHPVRARGRAGGSRFLIWIAQRA
ncbi:MAG: spermidine synthase [Thermoanaerobaculia bacterium]|jgi:spermidine synthase